MQTRLNTAQTRSISSDIGRLPIQGEIYCICTSPMILNGTDSSNITHPRGNLLYMYTPPMILNGLFIKLFDNYISLDIGWFAYRKYYNVIVVLYMSVQ